MGVLLIRGVVIALGGRVGGVFQAMVGGGYWRRYGWVSCSVETRGGRGEADIEAL